MEHGSFNLDINSPNWHKIVDSLEVKDILTLGVNSFGDQLMVLKGELEIGSVPDSYRRYTELLEAVKEGRPCECTCIRFHQGNGAQDSVIGVSFKMLDVAVLIR